MSNKDTNKVHEEAEKLAHKQQNLAVMSEMSGEDANAKYGVIAGGAGQTIVAENEALTTEHKKQKEFYRNLILQGLIKDLNKMFDDIDGMIDDFQASVDLSNRLIKARQENDIDEMKQILSTEYGVNTDGKTDGQICNLVDEKIEQEIDKQGDLEKAILKEIEKADREIARIDPDSPEAANQKEQIEARRDQSLERLKDIARIKPEILNYDNAEKRVLKQVGSDNEQLSSNKADSQMQERKEVAQEARTMSYSASIDEVDPFAEVASITDPFNAVATDMGYNSNDLDVAQPKQDVVLNTDLNVLNKPVIPGMN